MPNPSTLLNVRSVIRVYDMYTVNQYTQKGRPGVKSLPRAVGRSSARRPRRCRPPPVARPPLAPVHSYCARA
ncbi:hypothetical protein EVAR_81593_1 [Eumeta japonica]|uniref:Uncharacterized protein n=1 Tax=Eumeta variegata TaxID=151549 RepID=A0A4C1WDA8_EUMVA|nr:hypothetical protein EVAR_81593_1 [Eumeta japonica]